MSIVANDGGVLHKLSTVCVNGGGVIRKMSNIFANDSGVLQKIHSEARTLANSDIGSIVKIKENGVETDYIIIHKGLPSKIYDESCDGVWVTRKYVCGEKLAWSADKKNNYENSDIHTWLNESFYNIFDNGIKTAIKTVKIPYVKGITSTGQGVQTGVNGLSCKVFLLSCYEVGFTQSSNTDAGKYMLIDGAKLAYFSDNASRIAKGGSNTSGYHHYLRSPMTKGDSWVWRIGNGGGLASTYSYSTSYHNRPTFVLPYTVEIDIKGYIVV